METNALTWAVMFGLVTASSVACTSTSTPTYAPDHPCYGKGNCDHYLLLPDGGATQVPEAGPGDAGSVSLCGPCNG